MKDTESIEIRLLQSDDYDELKESMIAAYANWADDYWAEKQILKLIRIFPEGQIAIVVDNKVVGCALSLIVKYEHFGDKHTYKKITGNVTFNTHNPTGNILYGIEIFIEPGYRGMRLGRRLYDARKELCEKLNLQAIVFGGRIPNYHKYAEAYSPKEYIEKVKNRELDDPTLAFQLANDFHVKKIIKNYFEGDTESLDYAVLLQWDNVFYEPQPSKLLTGKSV